MNKVQMKRRSSKSTLSDEGLAARSINDFMFAVDKHEDVVKVVKAAAPDNKLLITSRRKQAYANLKERRCCRRGQEERSRRPRTRDTRPNRTTNNQMNV